MLTNSRPAEAGLTGLFIGLLALCVLATITWALRARRRGRRWWRSVVGAPQLLSVAFLLSMANYSITLENQKRPECLDLALFEAGIRSAAAPYGDVIAAQGRALAVAGDLEAFNAAGGMDIPIGMLDEMHADLDNVPIASPEQETILADLTAAMDDTGAAMGKQAEGILASDQQVASAGDRDLGIADAAKMDALHSGDALHNRCT